MATELPEILAAPETPAQRLGSARRRSAELLGLLIGLGLFFIWLPGGARVAVFIVLRAQWVLATLISLFALIAISLVWSTGQRLDNGIFRLINLRGYHPLWLDGGMWLVTQLGSLVATGLLASICFGLTLRGLAVEMIFGTLTLWLLVEVLKAVTHRARPFLDLQGTRIIGWRERGRSFPSGHTAQIFFLMTLLSHAFQLGLGVTVGLYAVAGLVGFTRVYVGAHYPRDAVGGAVLGSAWGLLATLVDPYWFGLKS